MSQEQIDKFSEKRLLQTSPPHATTLDALDAANGLRGMEECDFAWVTEDNRVVSIFQYNDITPDKPVMPGQRRIRIPNYSK